MTSSNTAAADSDAEYGVIHAALLETPRGRWFLAEHGRRARRVDANALEDAIAVLKASMNEPPAVLSQLTRELGQFVGLIAEARAALLDKPIPAAEASRGTPRVEPSSDILKTAEDIHEIAWSLQARDVDPEGCEAIARHAARLYAMSRTQAQVSERAIGAARSLDVLGTRLAAILDLVAQESTVQPLLVASSTAAPRLPAVEGPARTSADLALVHATRRR